MRDSLDIVEASLRGVTDISYIIRTLRDAYTSLYRYTVPEINRGHCDAFAESVARILPCAESRWDDTMPDARRGRYVGHCFIVYRERIFDAEAPDGVTKWTELPCETLARG